MAEAPRGPFREKSLERLSSPERLDQLLRVVDRKSWLPLITFGILIVAIVVWSVVGEISVTVEGRGILVRPRAIVEFDAPGDGYIESLDTAAGDQVEAGEVLARIARPDLQNRLQLQEQKKTQLTALARMSDMLREDQGNSDVDVHVDDVRALADAIQRSEIQAIDEEQRRLEEERTHAKKLQAARQHRLNDQRELEDQGLIAPLELLDAEDDWLDANSRVSALEAQIGRLETRRLEIDERYLERLRGIASFRLQIENHAQQIAEVDREIERIRVAIQRESRIVAEHAGLVIEINTSQGQFVTAGTRLGAMELWRDNSPFTAITYFSVRDGKRLLEKDHQQILITPDTVERQRYGGIRGEIVRISPFPVTLSEAENQIGNRELAELLIEDGFRIQVEARLLSGQEPGSFDWTSARGDEVDLTVGTTTTARVAVQRRRPITFVLPILKDAAGID